MSGGGEGAGALFAAFFADLAAAERLLAGRLPAIATIADDPTAIAFMCLVKQADQHLSILTELAGTHGVVLDGQPNLWMTAVLDDAERDLQD